MNEYLGILVGCILAVAFLWVILGVQASVINWQLSHYDNGDISQYPSRTYFVVRGPIVLYQFLKTGRPIHKPLGGE
jgi:hypothetical protein